MPKIFTDERHPLLEIVAVNDWTMSGCAKLKLFAGNRYNNTFLTHTQDEVKKLLPPDADEFEIKQRLVMFFLYIGRGFSPEEVTCLINMQPEPERIILEKASGKGSLTQRHSMGKNQNESVTQVALFMSSK